MSGLNREQLNAQILNGFWSDLKTHQERDAILIVSPELDLADVGLHVANDDVPKVEKWLASGELVKPSADQAKQWTMQSQKVFRLLIVAPYVLIQDLAH